MSAASVVPIDVWKKCGMESLVAHTVESWSLTRDNLSGGQTRKNPKIAGTGRYAAAVAILKLNVLT